MALKQKPKTGTGKEEYSSKHIETQRFPDNIRNSPAMYIGGVDAYGMWTCTKELLDNGADEYMAGRNDQVTLFLDNDSSYWVWDSGHGIPQGEKKWTQSTAAGKQEFSMATMEAVFGELHTSGKYRADAYAVSIGTHGVGAKGTNATAEYFDATTLYKGKWYSVRFERGIITQHVKLAKAPKLPTGELLKKGTLIHFKPDAKIFSVKSFPPSMAVEWAEVMAYMNPGLRITVQSHKSKKTYLSKIGPQEYIQARLEKLKVEGERVMFVHKDDLSDVVVSFANYDGCDLRGMTNSVTNSQGGKHVDSVTGALYDGLKPFIKTKKVDGKAVPLFREADLKEGLVGLVNAKLHKAQFSSQDKARLTDDRMGKDYEVALAKLALKFFKENRALALRLCERATKLNELKTKFTMSKKAAASLNAVKRNGLPAKYAGFDPKTKITDRELFIVEGDSASGSLKEARFPYQAILPLKGKILNALKDNKGKALESEEVINILAAIGYDVKAVDPYAKLTIGKIICLADPDPDGPFVADTQIRIRTVDDGDLGMQPHETEIQKLVGRKFEVPVWTSGAEKWVAATAELVRNVSTIVALEIGGNKYKVSEDHKFMVVRTPSTRGREASVYSETLCYICAGEMRIGDRVYCPSQEAAGKRDPNKQDRTTGKGFLAVNKLRVQKLAEPVPVYCLTVPRYHHFMLPSGIVSSNCHINSLLLTLFYKYLPELFKRGMVYVSAAPEFYAIHKGSLIYGETLSIVQKKLKKINAPASVAINHLKGWGEAGKNLMKVFAANPETRQLIQIHAVEKSDHVEFVKLMNDDVAYRREMLGLPANTKAEDDMPPRAPAKKVAVKKHLTTVKSTNTKIVQRRDSIEARRQLKKAA